MGARVLPASIGHRLLWYLDHYRGNDGALNCPIVCRLRGPLDVSALRRGLAQVVDHHEGLRTTFERNGRQIVQLVHEPGCANLLELDLSTASDPEAAAKTALAAELRTRIDPSAASLRTTLWRLGHADHLLCINMHHLVSDGTSGSIVFRDLRLACDGHELPAVGWQYAEFGEWQSAQLAAGGLRHHEVYWRDKLARLEGGAIPMLATASSRQAARETIVLPAGVVDGLRTMARRHRTTLYAMTLACYYRELHRITGRRDLAIASLFANRGRAELHNTVGFVANVVVLRVALPAPSAFSALVRATHTTVMEAMIHQAFPYHLLDPHFGRTRLDDAVFQMISEPMDQANLAGARGELVVPDGIGSRFECELSLALRDRALHAVLYFNAARIARPWAESFLGEYAMLLAAIAAGREPAIE